MAVVADQDQIILEAAVTVEAAVADTVETLGMTEEVKEGIVGAMVKIATADAVDGNITKI